MAAISSLSGAQTAPQSGLLQFKLQQATRVAEQAEQLARSLQAEVSAAQQAAATADENARAVATEANQAEVVAGQARADVTAIRSASQAQAQQTNAVSLQAETLKVLEPAIKSRPSAPPIINTQGQVTGTVVNTTA